VVIGSSSVNGTFGRLIAADFKRLGYRVSRHGFPSAGLARPDFLDLRQTLDRMPLDRNTVGVLMYVGGNDAQALWSQPGDRIGNGPWIRWQDARWSSAYETRASDLIGSLCDRHVQHAIVLAPADVVRPRLQARLERIRPALRRAAQGTSCGHFVSTAGDAERFDTDATSLRTGDGVHMTPAGAKRVWKRVRERVLGFMSDSVAQIN
jgi:hypothetical protein